MLGSWSLGDYPGPQSLRWGFDLVTGGFGLDPGRLHATVFGGDEQAPMGANIQWDLFRHGSTYLVRMLYNEKQTAFKAACTPIAKGSYYYSLTELEQCYNWSTSSS